LSVREVAELHEVMALARVENDAARRRRGARDARSIDCFAPAEVWLDDMLRVVVKGEREDASPILVI